MNWWLFFLTALIPLVIGAIYYHPKVAGTAWMKSNNFTTADLEGGNMPLIFSLTYLASLFVSVIMVPMVIHQTGFLSVMMEVEGYGVAGSEVMNEVAAFQKNYGEVSRNFGHGLFHGIFYALMLLFPVFGINALFERRSFKYVAVHVGYWVITLGLMGGIISQFLVLAA